MKSALLILLLVLSFTTISSFKRKAKPGLSLCCLGRLCSKNEKCKDTGRFTCTCYSLSPKKKKPGNWHFTGVCPVFTPRHNHLQLHPRKPYENKLSQTFKADCKTCVCIFTFEEGWLNVNDASFSWIYALSWYLLVNELNAFQYIAIAYVRTLILLCCYY